jgi:hypothetical protein
MEEVGHGLHGDGSFDGMAYWLLWQQCYGSVNISYGSGPGSGRLITTDPPRSVSGSYLPFFEKMCRKSGSKSVIFLTY